MISFEEFKLDEDVVNNSIYSQYRLDKEHIFILKEYKEWKAINQLKHCSLNIYMRGCTVTFEASTIKEVIEKFNNKEKIVGLLKDE